MKTLGQVAYEAYWISRISKFSGEGVPDWRDWDLEEKYEKRAWQAAAEAAVESFIEVKNA